MQEYNTHTNAHMDILLLTLFFASIEAPASSNTLTVSEWPLAAAHRSEVQLSWWKYYNQGKWYIRHYYQYHTM